MSHVSLATYSANLIGVVLGVRPQIPLRNLAEPTEFVEAINPTFIRHEQFMSVHRYLAHSERFIFFHHLLLSTDFSQYGKKSAI